MKQTRAESQNRVLARTTLVIGLCLGLPFCGGCAQVASHNVLESFAEGEDQPRRVPSTLGRGLEPTIFWGPKSGQGPRASELPV